MLLSFELLMCIDRDLFLHSYVLASIVIFSGNALAGSYWFIDCVMYWLVDWLRH